MTTKLGKAMGNKESLNQVESDSAAAVIDGNDSKSIQERSMSGITKSDQNSSKMFKYDSGLSMKGSNQFSKTLADMRRPAAETQQQQSQPQQLPSHIGFNQDMPAGKDFFPNYGSLQQPMFATSGYANGGSAFAGSMIPPMLVQQPVTVPSNIPGMFQTGFMYQTLPEPKSSYPKSNFFPPFTKGSLIMLSTGGLKPIEELKTVDFIESAKVSKQLSFETCEIAKIQDVPNSGISLIGFAVQNYEQEVLVEKQSDHPFYVYDQGWASCKPDVTFAQYGLQCQQLKVGDVCVFLSDRADNRSDKSSGLEIKTSVDDGVARRQPSFSEAGKFLSSQTANSKGLSLQDGKPNGISPAYEIGIKKSSPFENSEKPDDNSFGQPLGKKAKLDLMAGKNMQDSV